MQKDKGNFKNIIIALIVNFVLFPTITFAAKLYLEPTQGEYYIGDTFLVGARIDTEDECINTVEAKLNFPKDILEAVDFIQGNSILTLWVNPLSIEQESGLISFAGGIPGGYCGKLPGEAGEINLLGKIAFKIKEISERKQAEINFLEGSQVLLNDGLGTPAKLTTKGAIFDILAEKSEVTKDEWEKELEKDDIPPESFEIEIHQEPSLFEGKYFITFLTNDKQTGINKYEIKEGKRDWKIGQSPYLLENQKLTEEIKVKAVDKAGNERIEIIGPIRKPFPYLIIILILILIGIIIWVILKIRNKKIKTEEKK